MDEDKKNLHRVKFLDYKIDSGVTYYSISVTTLATSESWIFQSRYRNMLELHNQISSEVNIKLPVFPPKKWPGNLNPDFISQRQKSLENYFNNLLRVVNLDNLPILKNFLYTSFLNKESFPNKEPGFVKELKGCMESLLVNMQSFDQFSMKTQMIHCFQP